MKKIAVVGLGYVGLPLAALCAKQGYETIGFEKNIDVVSKLSRGQCHIKDEVVESLLAEAFDSGNFNPTADSDKIADCSIYLICVPTPIDANNNPDLEPLEQSISNIAPLVQKGDLIVVESTVFPGTCEQVVLPLIERISGLNHINDFYLAHCPERVNPGDIFWNSSNIPRVVGALTTDGVEIAAEFYASILGGEIYRVGEVRQGLNPKFSAEKGKLKVAQVGLGSVTMMRTIRDAEAVKAMENTVRDVNIAFVNELAKISDALNLDVVDIIDGMSTKPFGKGPFYPGAGVGGHCIAVDPEWLKSASEKAGYMPEMINLSRSINNGMPEYTVSILQDLLNDCGYPLKGTEVAVLGVAYKRNVDDPRESPFYPIQKILQSKSAKLNIFDSWYTKENTVSSVEEAVKNARALLIITEHSDIIDALVSLDMSKSQVEVVVDGRNCLNAKLIDKWQVHYRGIGRRAVVDSHDICK
jgi:UDP-N-acetyl-D-glucosamine dehydrogenase